MKNILIRALKVLGTAISTAFRAIQSSYIQMQENKQAEISKYQKECEYNINAVEIAETAEACASAIGIVQATPQNVKKPYNGTMQIMVYYLMSNNSEGPSIEEIQATLNHVLEERRRRRLTTPNVKPLYVTLSLAPQGYDVQIVGTNVTNTYVLPNVAYGKRIGKLTQNDNGFYIAYPDETFRSIPLGAQFEHLDDNDVWVKDYIGYDRANNIYRFGVSGKLLWNCHAKV